MGEQVMMRTYHLAGYAKKLCGRYCGPFAVLAVGRGTVTLDLPGSMKKVYATVNVGQGEALHTQRGGVAGPVPAEPPDAGERVG